MAIEFNAPNSLISAPSLLVPKEVAARTMSCWFRLHENPATNFQYGLMTIEAGAVFYSAWIGYIDATHCSVGVLYQIEIGSPHNGYKNWSWEWDNEWHHLVITHPAATSSVLASKAYLDGVELTGTAYSEYDWDISEPIGTPTFSMGSSVRYGAYNPIGQMYDCRLYNRALSGGEVSTLFTEFGDDTITDGLVIRWKLSDDYADGYELSDGDVFADLSGNVLIGTYHSSADSFFRSLANISLSTSSINTTAIEYHAITPPEFTLGYTGSVPYNYTITSNVPWLSVSPSSGTLSAAGDTVTVSYGSSTMAAGTYSGVLTVTAPGASNSPQQILVNLILNYDTEEAMARWSFQGNAFNGNGKVIPSATVTVCLANTTTAATIYPAATGPASATNVVTANSSGYFVFYVDDTDYDSTQKFKVIIAAPPTMPAFTATYDYCDIVHSDSTHFIPAGGTTGQVLSKKSGTSYDVEWATTGVFSSGEASKLAGIEAAADVTDATNVAAAGAVMTEADPVFTAWVAGVGEVVEDIVGGQLVNTDTVDLTYTDSPNGEIKADVNVQMSITSDASGLKLSGDSALAGLATTKFYGAEVGIGKGWYDLPSGTYDDEQSQDAFGAMVAGALGTTDTAVITYTDATPAVIVDVKKQMSITSDASGLKLAGDATTPGASKYYGTNGAGAKGFISFPAGAGDVIGPATNTADYIPQWSGTDSLTLKNGVAVPAGGLAGITALSGHTNSTSNPHSVTADQVLPTQTGHGGDYLATSGTAASWELPPWKVFHGIAVAGALTFNPTTHVLSMASGENTYWYQGTRVTTANAITCDIDSFLTIAANTLYYIYFNSTSGALNASVSEWNYYTHVPVCTVFWNGAAGAIGQNTHSYTRDIAAHYSINKVTGLRYESGLTMTKPSAVYDDAVDFVSGTLFDADLELTVTNPTNCRLWYPVSAGKMTYEDSDVPYLNVTDPGFNLKFMEIFEGSYDWSVVSGYIKIWVYASNDIDRPIYIIPFFGSSATSGLEQARNMTIDLSSYNMPTELKLLYTMIYRNTGQFYEAVDFRGSHQKTVVSAGSVSFSPQGSLSATDIQAAITDLDGNLVLVEAPLSGEYSGRSVPMTYGESIVAGAPVYYKSDGKVYNADANVAGKYPAIGIAMATASSGSNAVLLSGTYTNSGYSWTVGGVLYLSTVVGTMTQTKPSATNDCIQPIGVATAATRVLINPSLYFELSA